MNDLRTKKQDISLLFETLICIFYMWYFMPAANALFSASVFKYLFFGCFFAGLIGVFLFGKLKINMVTVAVFSYFIIFTVLYILNIGHASRHIRVSFTFWGTAILYFGLLEDDARLHMGKFLLTIYVVTCITSAIGVILDNSAARTIAHAGADDEIQKSYKLMNIANIYLFQSMIMFVPALVCLPKTQATKFFAFLLLAAIFFVLTNASFFISIIMFLFAIVISLVLKQKNKERMFAIILVTVLLLVLYLTGYDLLTMLYRSMDNAKLSERVFGLRELVYGGEQTGDAGVRWELYWSSIKTFLNNPFGVGVNYSYKKFDIGIGHHSQFLDDLARYGVAALAFYIVFFMGYYKHLKNAWDKTGYGRIATAVCIIYFVFLVLNLGFRSGEESVAMMYIMPLMPLLVEKRQTRRLTK